MERLRELVVAIDGPSGSGKSTVARAVAARLGLRYLDTGAIYRALTWVALHDGVALDDAEALRGLLSGRPVELSTDAAPVRVLARGLDISAAIRGADVTAAVSTLSAVPEVRAALLEWQRQIIDGGGIVVEGRDIGTTVAPTAAVKIFLTADPQARARRRSAELAPVAGAATAATTQADLLRRDVADSSRMASPLRQAEDALEVDSTDLSVDEVVELVVARALAAAA